MRARTVPWLVSLAMHTGVITFSLWGLILLAGGENDLTIQLEGEPTDALALRLSSDLREIELPEEGGRDEQDTPAPPAIVMPKVTLEVAPAPRSPSAAETPRSGNVVKIPMDFTYPSGVPDKKSKEGPLDGFPADLVGTFIRSAGFEGEQYTFKADGSYSYAGGG